MKKVLYTILFIMVLSFASCGKEQGPEPVIEETPPPPPPPPPTIEETLGFDGYSLLDRELSSPYNQVQFIAEIDMTATHNNSIVDYKFESSKLHESDGYVSYSVTLNSLTNEFRTINTTHQEWVAKSENTIKYYNDNYSGWYYTDGTPDNISGRLHLSDKMTYTCMEDISQTRIKVIGESTTTNGSYFDNYIKSIISQFGTIDCAYTFEANYDYNTHELISVNAEISMPGEVRHGEYICTVDSMTVSMVVIEQDNLKRLGVPENCKQGTYVPNTQVTETPIPTEPTENVEPVESVEEPTVETTEETSSEVSSEPTESSEETESTPILPPLA